MKRRTRPKQIPGMPPPHFLAEALASLTRRQGGSAPLPPATGERPFFVVGCGRSGTTLLNVMLGLHPRLAVVPESWLHAGWRRARRNSASLEDVFKHCRYFLWGADPKWVGEWFDVSASMSYPDLISAAFGSFAGYIGKSRWGEKTSAARQLRPLARLFPDAQFVHIIRDGREVATSLASQEWGPPNAAVGACTWRLDVTLGRSAARRLDRDRYLEIRYEELVVDPEATLKRVCSFLREDYDPVMVDYSKHVAEMEPWLSAGELNLAKPPTAGVRDWRSGIASSEQRAVEAICHPLLMDLGYEAAETKPLDIAAALALIMRGIPSKWTVVSAMRMLV